MAKRKPVIYFTQGDGTLLHIHNSVGVEEPVPVNGDVVFLPGRDGEPFTVVARRFIYSDPSNPVYSGGVESMTIEVY